MPEQFLGLRCSKCKFIFNGDITFLPDDPTGVKQNTRLPEAWANHAAKGHEGARGILIDPTNHDAPTGGVLVRGKTGTVVLKKA